MQTESLPSMKIAFLEDDAAFAANIIDWLEQAGHTVTWFRAGRECVRALTDARYDLCTQFQAVRDFFVCIFLTNQF